MARASVDPAELRRFARDLHRFNGELQNLMSAFNVRSQELARSWRDQEHQKFAEQMDQTLKQLHKFTHASEEHAQFLVRKAGQIEAYLQQR